MYLYLKSFVQQNNMDGTTTTARQISEVENLIKQFYEPGPGGDKKQLNDQLQQIQLSQDGWRLADELMLSKELNVRFYAALTFTVKLNNDGSV